MTPEDKDQILAAITTAENRTVEAMGATAESLTQLIADQGASLQREMISGFDRIEAATAGNPRR